MTNDYRLFLVLVAALALLASVGCGMSESKAGDVTGGDDKPAPSVQVATAATGDIDDSLQTTGTLSVPQYEEAAVSPLVNGVVDSLPIRMGQDVNRGQLIGHISTQALNGQIQQARAALSQNEVQVTQAQINAIQQRAQTRAAVLQAQSAVLNAQATLASDQATLTGDEATQHEADQDYVREENLYHDGLVAGKDVLDAKLALQTAESQVDAQRQTIEAQRQTVDGQIHALEAAKTGSLTDVVKRKDIDVAEQQVANARGALATYSSQVGLYTLRAPLSGRVTAVGAAVGESVDSSTKVVTISNLDELQLDIAVPAEASGRIHAGQIVAFDPDSDPGNIISAMIRTVSPQVDTSSNTITATALVPNLKHLLKDDDTVKAQVHIDPKRGVILVPTAAILTDPDTSDKTVAVVGPDDTLHVVPVTLGVTEGNKTEVISGVTAGQKVAIAGQYGVADGTKVSVAGAP